nr:MAG TPA: hypothetical protein [Caudoviricetes sp.]
MSNPEQIIFRQGFFAVLYCIRSLIEYVAGIHCGFSFGGLCAVFFGRFLNFYDGELQ